MKEHLTAGGDPNPHHSYRMPNGYSLGRILDMNRRGRTSYTLTDDQRAELESLGTRRTMND